MHLINTGMVRVLKHCINRYFNPEKYPELTKTGYLKIYHGLHHYRRQDRLYKNIYGSLKSPQHKSRSAGRSDSRQIVSAWPCSSGCSRPSPGRRGRRPTNHWLQVSSLHLQRRQFDIQPYRTSTAYRYLKIICHSKNKLPCGFSLLVPFLPYLFTLRLYWNNSDFVIKCNFSNNEQFQRDTLLRIRIRIQQKKTSMRIRTHALG